MKALKIDGDKWTVVDLDKPHLKPKVVAGNPYRYWHYPILECKNLTIDDFWSRVRNNNGLNSILRSFGLNRWTYFNSVKHPPKGQVIIQQDHGKYICNPNVNHPNFNHNDIADFQLILDPIDRSGNPARFSLDKVVKTIIINVFGGDENCLI